MFWNTWTLGVRFFLGPDPSSKSVALNPKPTLDPEPVAIGNMPDHRSGAWQKSASGSLHTLGPNVSIICILGSLGLGFRVYPTESDKA